MSLSSFHSWKGVRAEQAADFAIPQDVRFECEAEPPDAPDLALRPPTVDSQPDNRPAR